MNWCDCSIASMILCQAVWVSKQESILLIFDLDETLIHSTGSQLENPADCVVGPFYVYQRPHLHEFLIDVEQHFQLAVWSSAASDYVSGVVEASFPPELVLEFCWARERCIWKQDYEKGEPYFLKDLKKVKRLGYSLDRILIVEDTPQKVARNYGNAIYVTPFTGNTNDDQLLHLSKYLHYLKSENNVRQIEKRDWRNRLPI